MKAFLIGAACMLAFLTLIFVAYVSIRNIVRQDKLEDRVTAIEKRINKVP